MINHHALMFDLEAFLADQPAWMMEIIGWGFLGIGGSICFAVLAFLDWRKSLREAGPRAKRGLTHPHRSHSE